MLGLTSLPVRSSLFGRSSAAAVLFAALTLLGCTAKTETPSTERAYVARDSVAIRATVGAVVEDQRFGRFSLQSSQIPPYNAFVPLSLLQKEAEVGERVNTLLIGASAGEDAEPVDAERARRAVGRHWTLMDANVEVVEHADIGVTELRTERVFLEPPIVEAAERAVPGAQKVLT